MRLTGPPTEAQIARVQQNWKRVSRFGVPRFVLAVGSILFLWMMVCFVAMMYLMDWQRLLHERILIDATIPYGILFSYGGTFAYFWLLRRMARLYPPPGTAI